MMNLTTVSRSSTFAAHPLKARISVAAVFAQLAGLGRYRSSAQVCTSPLDNREPVTGAGRANDFSARLFFRCASIYAIRAVVVCRRGERPFSVADTDTVEDHWPPFSETHSGVCSRVWKWNQHEGVSGSGHSCCESLSHATRKDARGSRRWNRSPNERDSAIQQQLRTQSPWKLKSAAAASL